MSENQFRVLVDTSALISAMLFRGESRKFLETILEKHRLVLSTFIISETSRVVAKKFPDQLGFWDRQLSQMSFELVYTPEDFSQLDLPQTRDENDLPILASAVISQPDLIVTGDKDFKSREIQEYFAIYTPGEFLRFLNPKSSRDRDLYKILTDR